jgi:hypothetical protein
LTSRKDLLHTIWLSAALTSSSLLAGGLVSKETLDKSHGGKPVQSETNLGGDRNTSQQLSPQEIVRGKRWRWRLSAFITPSTNSVPDRLTDLIMTLEGG